MGGPPAAKGRPGRADDVTHLLVSNDFPPKVGGIQAYLWELWRRFDPDSFAVLTARSHPEARAFDREQAAKGIRIERVRSRVLAPTPHLVRRIRETAQRVGADLVVLDPLFPLGLIGPRLGLPYAVLLHGAEVAIPSRLPASRQLVANVLRHSTLAVSAGGYPATEAARALRRGTMPPVVEIPPGVDPDRFRPLSSPEQSKARARLGLPPTGPLVVSVSRLVPRKGMDVLITAAGRLAQSYPDLVVAIGGEGRELGHLRRQAASSPIPVILLGRVSDEDRAALLGSADIFVMACRNRWLGLEQEGFGIVFLEAAAAGVPQIAGDSGGAAEAVVDGVTGLGVERPEDPGAVAEALRSLLADPARRRRMGRAARARVQESFDNDVLASRLAEALAGVAI